MNDRLRQPAWLFVIGLVLFAQSMLSRQERMRAEAIHLRQTNSLKVWCWLAAMPKNNPAR